MRRRWSLAKASGDCTVTQAASAPRGTPQGLQMAQSARNGAGTNSSSFNNSSPFPRATTQGRQKSSIADQAQPAPLAASSVTGASSMGVCKASRRPSRSWRKRSTKSALCAPSSVRVSKRDVFRARTLRLAPCRASFCASKCQAAACWTTRAPEALSPSRNCCSMARSRGAACVAMVCQSCVQATRPLRPASAAARILLGMLQAEPGSSGQKETRAGEPPRKADD
mmetsp:Transcript_104092/g.222372  ORF Transcript_104092/g.222372 Transcript_104092/m.222372 type:complete len:225 (+) Transcript_104092:290-964(+)